MCGTMHCPFFLFCSHLDPRYVLPLMYFGVCWAQACLKKMLNEMQKDFGQRGVREGPSGPQSVRFKCSHFSQEKCESFKTQLCLDY